MSWKDVIGKYCGMRRGGVRHGCHGHKPFKPFFTYNQNYRNLSGGVPALTTLLSVPLYSALTNAGFTINLGFQISGSKHRSFISTTMDDDLPRMSTRARKVAPKMAAALASTDNRTQAILARLEALENDNPEAEIVEPNDDDDASLDEDDDRVFHKKQSKGTKRKTRQAKALETAKKAPSTFLELLHDANLEWLPSHVPTYLRAAVGPPTSTCRRYFCTVCGFSAKYTCVRCGMRFCAPRCQNIHNDTRCLKFVA